MAGYRHRRYPISSSHHHYLNAFGSRNMKRSLLEESEASSSDESGPLSPELIQIRWLYLYHRLWLWAKTLRRELLRFYAAAYRLRDVPEDQLKRVRRQLF